MALASASVMGAPPALLAIGPARVLPERANQEDGQTPRARRATAAASAVASIGFAR